MGIKPTAPSFDPELALIRANGNHALVEELHGLLLKDIVIQKDHLLKAGALHDLDTLQNIAHRLQGGCRYCGAPELEQAVFELEKALQREGFFQASLDATIVAIDNLLLIKRGQ